MLGDKVGNRLRALSAGLEFQLYSTISGESLKL